MSSLTLALDGSTHAASVALLRDGKLIGEARAPEAAAGETGGRGEALVPLIAKLLGENGIRADQVTEVVCGAGPGSFTSLRVSASVGKGIAAAAGAKIYAVPSLLLNFAGTTPLEDGTYLSTLPAMRGELFALPVTLRGGVPSAISPHHSILDAPAALAEAKEHGARIVGPDQEVESVPHARGVAALYKSVIASGPVDLDTWEPDYGRLAEAQVKWEATHGRQLKA